ncbi:MAG TPA: DUF488 domain-containing protein [Egibacteraceae bacterium]
MLGARLVVVSGVRIRRVYDPPEPEDGFRILIDRVWPRGVSKEEARVDEWRRDLAPSTELRRWFGHDPARFDEFRRRYRAELEQAADALDELVERARDGVVTLVYGARDTEHNNAVVLRELLEERLG